MVGGPGRADVIAEGGEYLFGDLREVMELYWSLFQYVSTSWSIGA